MNTKPSNKGNHVTCLDNFWPMTLPVLPFSAVVLGLVINSPSGVAAFCLLSSGTAEAVFRTQVFRPFSKTKCKKNNNQMTQNISSLQRFCGIRSFSSNVVITTSIWYHVVCCNTQTPYLALKFAMYTPSRLRTWFDRGFHDMMLQRSIDLFDCLFSVIFGKQETFSFWIHKIPKIPFWLLIT